MSFPAEIAPTERLPLYRQLARTLQQQIDSGAFVADQPLPSEREIALSHGMSRDTVRKALNWLEQQGLLYSEQGRGTFLAPEAVRQMTRSMDSFSQDIARRGSLAGQIILTLEQIPATMAIAGILDIAPRQMVMHLRRIRTVDGLPVGLQDAWLALPDGGRFSADDLHATGSLYKLLQKRFGLRAAEGLESLGSVSASADDAAHLGVTVGAPLLMCERITLTERRKPMEYCEMRYIPSYRYTVRIHGSQRR